MNPKLLVRLQSGETQIWDLKDEVKLIINRQVFKANQDFIKIIFFHQTNSELNSKILLVCNDKNIYVLSHSGELKKYPIIQASSSFMQVINDDFMIIMCEENQEKLPGYYTPHYQSVVVYNLNTFGPISPQQNDLKEIKNQSFCKLLHSKKSGKIFIGTSIGKIYVFENNLKLDFVLINSQSSYPIVELKENPDIKNDKIISINIMGIVCIWDYKIQIFCKKINVDIGSKIYFLDGEKELGVGFSNIIDLKNSVY